MSCSNAAVSIYLSTQALNEIPGELARDAEVATQAARAKAQKDAAANTKEAVKGL